ncbi:MAG TPA: hypothetical protein VF829_00110 [Candidatus Paceibacterota bacterium]
MILVLLANVVALFFSAFVAGVLVGVLLIPSVRRTVADVLSHVAERLRRRPALLLARPTGKPILTPRANLWEDQAVLNPAALDLGGRVHLIYRAIGRDGVSRFGYASSADGFTFDQILPYPVFAVRNPGGPGAIRRYSPVLYPSGGSWGGAEDPRMVAINGRVYVTFNLFENWVLRVGFISMREEDFLAQRFDRWDGPYILSSSNREKNWTIFPEKIGGKFAVLHGIIDEDDSRVRIEYTDTLETLSQKKFETVDPQKVPDKHIAWHVHVRSAGPPPLKTPYGWLVLYHAHDADEPHRYKLGAMLLDLEDPTKILHRAPHPILEPDVTYENDGKPGVVYACGAVEKDGALLVYYGGGDRIAAVASAPFEAFLQALMRDEAPALATEPLTRAA